MAQKTPVSSGIMPGRRMISTPTKPMAMADQRRARTISPSSKALPMVAKSGAVKLIAVTSASGSMVTAVIHSITPILADRPRNSIRPGRTGFR